jgi:hypothetical protein
MSDAFDIHHQITHCVTQADTCAAQAKSELLDTRRQIHLSAERAWRARAELLASVRDAEGLHPQAERLLFEADHQVVRSAPAGMVA